MNRKTPLNSPSRPTRSEVNAFIKAALYGDDKAITEIIARHGSAIINEKDISGRTALMCAAFTGHPGIVKMLLEKGADIDIKYGPADWSAIDFTSCPETRTVLAEWPETQRQRIERKRAEEFAKELAEITKTIMGGLKKPMPYKPPFGGRKP